MSRPIRIEFENACYHVIARGDRKDNIFIKSEYKYKLLSLMNDIFNKYGVICYAYCIMDNHYHLFICTPEANLVKTITQINTHYSNWYKNRTNFVGHVFQGRYKSMLVDSDNYALQLVDYIHKNPVESRIVRRPDQYFFSSMQYYINKQNKPFDSMDKNFILSKFSNNSIEAGKLYLNHIKKQKPLILDKRKIYKSVAYGSEEFHNKIRKIIENQRFNSEIPTTKMHKTRRSDYFIALVEKEFKVNRDEIFINKSKNVPRKVLIYLLKKYSRLKLREIGTIFSVSYSAISMSNKRFEEMLKNDKSLSEKISKIVKCEDLTP